MWGTRTAALLRLGGRRLLGRLRGEAPAGVVLAVCGVAVTVAFVVAITGVSLGLASQTTVQSDDVDFWVVPESGSSTLVADTDGPRLGAVHDVSARLAADDRVTYATPVLLGLLNLTNPATDDSAYVLLVGVIPPPDGTTTQVFGLSTAPLAPGDPHYANGDYDGRWTGELVVSDGAAGLLNASNGSRLTTGDREFAVQRVEGSGPTTGAGTVPVALGHLAEVQTVAGATDGDQADQLLVATNDAGVRPVLEGLYPSTDVVTRSGLGAAQVSQSGLPRALAAAAFVVALAVGGLLVATLMGLEVTGDRRALATLGALGFSTRSRATVVAGETITLTLLGGLVGVAVGAVLVRVINALSTRFLGVAELASFPPILAGYGVVITVLIGLLAAPYPIWLSVRTDPVEVMSG